MMRSSLDGFLMPEAPGQLLRDALQRARNQQEILPFVGIYDLFSVSLVANRSQALLVSGFGLAASSLGLPDFGFIGWGDHSSCTGRLRSLLPHHHLLVDIDDGFGDASDGSAVLQANLRRAAGA